jgi:pimeloyl-ACP methyl ester carboxylesterase
MKRTITLLVVVSLLTLVPIRIALAYLPAPGVQFELIEFQGGKETVQGGFFSPDPKKFAKPTAGVILVHGVESYWYKGPAMFLSAMLAERGYAALTYNGAHSGSSFRTSEFETAVAEIADAVQLMKQRGFTSIVIIGHSLGTPMVEYFQGDKPDPAVKAIGLYGPHINIPAVTRDSLLGPEAYAKFLAECRKLVAEGKGGEIKLLPYREGRSIITSAKTFISYRDIDTSKAAVEKMVRLIKVPMIIGYDPADNIEGIGGTTKREVIVNQIKETAVAAPRIDVLVAPSVAGNSSLQAHSFVKNERLVTEKTAEWLKAVGLQPAAGVP